ncbi:MAG: sigma-70 family RNA polymerase sigma factor [Deltaproteobacteria bacterium]|nr:sigma-70 family RNA polymerase sigma factor [Candidatus Desulfobacula maris]
MRGPQNITNANLMVRVKKGDRDAFATLVQFHQDSVLNFIWHFMGDRTEAEDLAQEAFLRVWKSAATYKPRAKFSTWLYRIVTNLCINRHRALKIRNLFSISSFQKYTPDMMGVSESEPGVNPVTPEDRLLKAEQYQQIFNALDTLPPAQRMAIVLTTNQGLSYSEISQIMGRSVSAVDALLIRAKKNLQKKLSVKK